jgi:long-chain fatty acid transport protein
MKKLIFISLMCIATCSIAQMDNLSNLSADWIRIGARNAATNGTDIVAYNPAGLTNLTPGFHLNFCNQSLFRSPSHSYDFGFGEGRKSFTQDGSDPFIPSLYLSYNLNTWAFFGGIYIAGGGATMNYPTGSLTTDLIALQALQSTGGAYMSANNQNLKATSAYMTYMAGAAYSLSKKFSLSVAIRNISAENTAKGGMTLSSSPIDLPDQPLAIEFDETASGIGAVIGFNFNCTEKLNIAGRYETKVELDFKTKQIVDDFGITTDGQLNRRDLPAVAALGISYDVTETINSYFDFNYYFQEQADWGKSSIATNEKTYSSMAGDVFSIGAGIEYGVNTKLTASIGGGYTKYLYDDKAGYYTRLGTFEVMQDNNANVNTGLAYQISKKTKISAGYMHTFWAKDQNIKAALAQPLDVDVKVNNSLDAIALGIDFKF